MPQKKASFPQYKIFFNAKFKFILFSFFIVITRHFLFLKKHARRPCRGDKVFHSYHMDNKENAANNDQREIGEVVTTAPIAEEQEQENQHDELHVAEDFSGLGKQELLDKMEEASSNPDPEQVKGTIQKLKETFRALVSEELEAKR